MQEGLCSIGDLAPCRSGRAWPRWPSAVVVEHDRDSGMVEFRLSFAFAIVTERRKDTMLGIRMVPVLAVVSVVAGLVPATAVQADSGPRTLFTWRGDQAG